MGKDSRLYTLSYVNEPFDKVTHLDRQFKSLIQLVAYVEGRYPTYTSYQVIVVRRGQ